MSEANPSTCYQVRRGRSVLNLFTLAEQKLLSLSCPVKSALISSDQKLVMVSQELLATDPFPDQEEQARAGRRKRPFTSTHPFGKTLSLSDFSAK